jgi:hypothetical protein
VGFLRAADQQKILSGRDALVAVGIKAEAEERRFAFFFAAGIRHQSKLPAVFRAVKPGRNSRRKILQKQIHSAACL